MQNIFENRTAINITFIVVMVGYLVIKNFLVRKFILDHGISMEKYNDYKKNEVELYFISLQGLFNGLEIYNSNLVELNLLHKLKDASNIPFNRKKKLVICAQNNNAAYQLHRILKKHDMSFEYLGDYKTMKKLELGG